MARSSTGGIPGLAVGLATAGGLLLFSGIKNLSVRDALKQVLAGTAPGQWVVHDPTGPALGDIVTNVDQAAVAPKTPIQTTTQPGQGLGGAIADTARAYLGRPYVWAGNFDGGGGGDCSGLAYRAMNDAGVKAPRLTTLGYLAWSGAKSIARGQCAAGDLVCWTGHMGIAINGTQMIHAPHAGAVVSIATIWNNPPPVIRRVWQDGATPVEGLSAR